MPTFEIELEETITYGPYTIEADTEDDAIDDAIITAMHETDAPAMPEPSVTSVERIDSAIT